MPRRAEDELRLQCPKCQNRLHERPLRETGVKVDVCPSCRGLWFEIGELQRHLDTVEGKFVPPADARVSRRPCPACRVQMTAFEYLGTGVDVDFCESCRGVWLDVGEIKGLAKKPEGGFLGLVGKAITELKFW